MIGATNVLFVQKKGLADVVIEIEKDRFDVQDPELKRALHLTTEDLRFTDNLVRQVHHHTLARVFCAIQAIVLPLKQLLFIHKWHRRMTITNIPLR